MGTIKLWIVVLIVFGSLGAFGLVIADTQYRKFVDYCFWIVLVGMMIAVGGAMVYTCVR